MSQPHGPFARIGRTIHEARRARALSRRALATDAGISERYLAQLEKGEANASLAVLLNVTRTLGLDAGTLISGANDETNLEALPQDPLAGLIASLDATERTTAHALLKRKFSQPAAASRLHGIALVGLRGAGKSTLGQQLAETTAHPFVRLTALIEEHAGLSAGEIFSLGGPEAFRSHEAAAIRRVIDTGTFTIVETPGGLVANTAAWDLLRRTFHTVWLKTSPREHMSRVVAQGDLRPMSGDDQAMIHLQSLLDARAPLYARAHCTLETGGQTVAKSLKALQAICRSAIAAASPHSGGDQPAGAA